MRNIWLGIALVPYLAVAGVDFWMHERGRRVPRAEQWVHAGLALTMAAFLAAVFAGRAAFALAALAVFVALLAWDELAFHGAIAASERRVHVVSWAALAGFVAAWWIVDAP
jgi:hypothetical protein